MKTNCIDCGTEIKYDGRSWKRSMLYSKPDRCIPCGTKILVKLGRLPESALDELAQFEKGE